MAGRTDGVAVNIGLSTKKALKNVRDLNKEVNSLGKSINTAFQTTAIIGWGKAIMNVTQQMINASKAQSEYIENFNLLEVSYKNNTGSAEKLMDTLKNFYGLDPSGLTKQLATYKQMTSAMQLGEEASSLLSENLLKMQEDVASLYNLDFERVGSKFQSALAGQTRAVRDLGVDITQTSLQQELYNRGIDKSITDMNRASKTVLIYLAMERQLSNAQGDAARTINSVANQTKIFKEQISIASRQIGALFIPVLKTVLPVLNGILMTLNAIGEFILGLLGLGAKDLASEFGIKTISTDFDDLGGNLDEAGKKADKLYGKLRPFDKLNVITTPTDKNDNSSKFGGGIDKDLYNSLKSYNEELEKAKNKAKEIRDAILGWLGFTVDENGQIKDFHITLGSIAGMLIGGGLIIKGVKGVLSIVKNIKSLSDKVLGNSKTHKTILERLLSPLSDMKNHYTELRSQGKGILESAEGARELWVQSASVADKVKLAVIGIAEVLGGITISNISYKSLIEDGMNLVNVIGLIGGAILTVKGAIEATTAIVGLFNVELAKNPATAVIGALIGAGGLVASLLITKNEIDNTRNSFEALSVEQKNSIQSNANHLNSIKELSKELQGLMDSNGKVQKSDEVRVDYILHELNDALGTEYKLTNGQITANGKLVTSYGEIEKEIDKYIVKLQGQYVIERLKDKYNEALDRQYDKQKRINAVNDEHKKLLEDLRKQYDNNEISWDEYSSKVSTANKEHERMLTKLNEDYKQSEELIDKYQKLSYAVTTGNMNDIKKYYDEIMSMTVSESTNYAETYSKQFNAALNKAELSGKSYIETKFGTNNDWYNAGQNNGNSYFNGLKKSLQGKKLTFENSSVDMGTYSVKAYADGGFIDRGDFFVMNENEPEYLGRIGNKTAVANNDQIVSAISIGVERAMSRATTNSNVVIKADADTEGLLNFINFKQQQMNRQYGL